MALQKKVYEEKGEEICAEATVVEEKQKEVAAETRPKRAYMPIDRARVKSQEAVAGWKPKTEIGKKVKSKEISDIQQVVGKGLRIREAEVVDTLIPNLQSEYVFIGQAHGKFGGGKRREIRQTQKKTAEGNKPSFTALVVVGNGDGYVGIGRGTAKEGVPAREKAI